MSKDFARNGPWPWRPQLCLSMRMGLGPIGELYGGSHIFLQASREKRKSPLFILNKRRNAKCWSYPEVGADGSVVDRASVGNELVIDFEVPVSD